MRVLGRACQGARVKRCTKSLRCGQAPIRRVARWYKVADSKTQSRGAPEGDTGGIDAGLPDAPTLLLQPSETEQFDGLRDAMRDYAIWSTLSSTLSALMLWNKFSLTNGAGLVVHSSAALLVAQASTRLPTSDLDPTRHLPVLMQGIRGLSVVFMQLSTIHWFRAAVTMMDAAISWPQLITLFAALVGVITLVRMLCLQYVINKYPIEKSALIQVLAQMQRGETHDISLIDQFALYVVGGYMMICYDLPTRGEIDDEIMEGKQPQDESVMKDDAAASRSLYEFSKTQERSFAILMDSMRDAAGATFMMSFAALLIAMARIAQFGIMNASWCASAMDAIEAGVMSFCMLFSVGCFSRVITTKGKDVELVIAGISDNRGLTTLFKRLKGVQFGFVIITLITAAGSRLGLFEAAQKLVSKVLARLPFSVT